MSETINNCEISGELLTKIFLHIENSLNKKSTPTKLSVKNIENKEKTIKLAKVNFNAKNPFLSKIKKIRKESISSNKTS